MVKQTINIGHLYPKEMNIYGDTGNVLVLARRLEWRGVGVNVVPVGVGEALPGDVDIIVSGGGQDKGQLDVESDLLAKQTSLQSMADDGVVMLLICGTYQLFGHRFVTGKNEEIRGIGVLDVETFAGEERMIGNVSIDTEHGILIGYENHSGQTYLGKDATSLGSVKVGGGNNGVDGSEGAVVNNVHGTYLHGPILPKNPVFADHLIGLAMQRKYGASKLKELDDSAETLAHQIARTRPR